MEIVTLDSQLWFGKYKGKTIRDIIDDSCTSYILWCIDSKIFELDSEGYQYLYYEIVNSTSYENAEDYESFKN